MMQSPSYRNAFVAAVILHLFIAVILMIESTTQRPVLVAAAKTEATQSQQPIAIEQEEQAIKAVSVDSQEVMNTVNRLKQERLQQKQAEENRQQTLARQAEAARKQRVEEQQRLERLKNEAAKLALLREKQMVEEQRHLKQLAQQKAEQEKALADMKNQKIQLQKQQQQEADKLAELQKKKSAELARAEQIKQAQAKQDLANKQQAASQQAALDAQKNARLAGAVDKYKALIINAISRQWILPENANSSLSSQFRIRLAPNGVVLEVSLTRSSGDAILDRSAQSAIYKASPLPVPSDPDTFNLFRDISLTVRPENARG